MLFDEFYSTTSGIKAALHHPVLRYVDDVNSDPVVIFDGLTKNWRYPGWRYGPLPKVRSQRSAAQALLMVEVVTPYGAAVPPR